MRMRGSPQLLVSSKVV